MLSVDIKLIYQRVILRGMDALKVLQPFAKGNRFCRQDLASQIFETFCWWGLLLKERNGSQIGSKLFPLRV